MKNRLSLSTVRIALATVVLTALATTSVPVQALTFDEIVSQLEATVAVQEGRVAREVAGDRLALAEFRGDPRLTLTPSATLSGTEEDWAPEETELRGSLVAEIPLALSRTAQNAVAAAADTLTRARAAEDYNYAAAYADLLSAYHAAWLAQRDAEVLGTELVAMQEAARVAYDRFDRGTATLREVQAAEEDLVDAEIAYREGSLAQRLRSIELLSMAGMPRTPPSPLEPAQITLAEIPRPPELTLWAVTHDPRLQGLSDTIAALRRETDALDGVVGAPTVRTGFSGNDQSVSAAFNTDQRELSLSYGFHVATIGSLESTRSSSSDSANWEVSFSVALPLQTTGSSGRESRLAADEQAQAAVEITAIERDLAVAIRSAYQQYELSPDRIDDARRSLEVAEQLRDTVIARHADERATEADLLAAEAQFQRARYRLDAAEIAREDAKIRTARAASYLNQLIGTIHS
ncbi:MAG: TolC family protein [Alkalispirochaeta sp.]